MIRITALNDQTRYANGSQKSSVQISTTKEAVESEAISLYNKGLNLRNQGHIKQAVQTLTDVLNSPFLQEATLSNLEDGALHSAELLKYSAYKNLAEMSEKDGNFMVAMGYYIEAVTVDSTDVTVWYKMGKLAMNIDNFALALHAFEMGLQCNSNHWPCLDNIISLLYALNNYEVCLYYIAKALELDPGYTKGIIFMRKIFSEHPGLRSWSLEIFLKCDHSIHLADIDQEEADEYLNEALQIRVKKQELSKSIEIPTVTFTKPLTSFTWKCLGECLVSLYEHISLTLREQTNIYDGSQPRISLASRVDLSANVNLLTSLDAASAPASPPSVLLTPAQINNSTTVVDQSLTLTPTQEKQMSTTEMCSVIDVDQSQYSGGRKRGRKRKNVFLDEPECKRRSTRVRNPAKSSNAEGSINYFQELCKLLPKSLLSGDGCQSSSDLHQPDMTSAGDDSSKDPNEKCSLRHFENETEDVQKFLNDHKENSGLIHLINKYLIVLAKLYSFVWPIGLKEIYMKLYQKLRKHIVYPNYLANDDCDERICNMAKMSLVQKELKLDHWLSNSISIIQPSSGKSSVTGLAASDFSGKYFELDVEYLVGLTALPDKLGDFWLELCIRVFWLQARYFLLQNKLDLAIDCFEQTAEFLEMLNDNIGSSCPPICLANCTDPAKVISLRAVEQKLDSLKMCQSMEELRRLADSGKHSKVIDFLLPSFTAEKDLDIERMKLLQESIVAAKEYKKGLLWAEEYFHETWRRYKSATSNSQKDIRKDILIQILQTLNQFLDDNRSILSSLPSQWLYRLSQNLIDLISVILDAPESITEMAIKTVSPWMILYRLIKHCEQMEKHQNDAKDNETLSSSLAFIISGHEYLGRRSWCTTCEGEFLLLIIEAFTEELEKYSSDDPHPYEEDLDNALQQCYYCLYGHRSKKAKYLDDHNVPQISLTLERCQRVFNYFKPKMLPEYDSYKMNAISAELEILFRRICTLIPVMDISGIEAEITTYIDGATNSPPAAQANKEIKYSLVKELYYLLADYYFKNKEQLKAIKFYLCDICFNPTRFDSWAGMALARSSRLEHKLISHDLKQEASLQKQAFSTLRCFKRAMELDDSNVKLWIEYGSCAYQLHSHASRLLKQTKFSALSKETVDQAFSNKKEMLMIALNCYNQAEACAMESGNKEEKWLLHYMLGKIAEKMNQDPKIYLDHYKKASNYLHEDKAKYPKKISYFSPPHLSVEALEMYYRRNVCMLKYLMKCENEMHSIPFDVFESHIKDASNGPLIHFAEKEKKHDKKSEMADNKDLRESGARGACNDHNYSKQKIIQQSITTGTASHQDTLLLLAHQQVSLNSAPLPYPGFSSASVPLTQYHLNDRVNGKDTSLALDANLALVCLSEKTKTEIKDEVEALRSSEDQPLDLTVHCVTTTLKESEVVAPINIAFSSITQEEAQETSTTEPKTDIFQPACEQPGSEQGQCQSPHPQLTSAALQIPLNNDFSSVSSKLTETVSVSNSDSDDLEALISTLAAVQKSIEEDRQDNAIKKIGNEGGSDCVATMPSVASEIVKNETDKASMETTIIPFNAESQNNEIPMEMKTFQAAAPMSRLENYGLSSVAILTMRPEGVSMTCSERAKDEVEMEQEAPNAVMSSAANFETLKPNTVATSDKSLLDRYLSLMNDCMQALIICQTRFPEHFKSVYRLAYVHFYSIYFKNISRCKELLLGGSSVHFGLFHERKQNNFFNGLWRNPVQDLDRWGSFSAHINRSLLLLFDVLAAIKDSVMLFSLHLYLCRNPVDIGKKYLRDADRIQLARMAFMLCCKCLEEKVLSDSKGVALSDSNKQASLSHFMNVRQQSQKLNLNTGQVEELYQLAQKLYAVSHISEMRPLLDEAFLHCSQLPTMKSPLLGSTERDTRHSEINLPYINKLGIKPPVVLPVEKHFQVPNLPVQRPLFPDKFEKPPIVPDIVEIIDLSADDGPQVINISSSADEEMATDEVDQVNDLSGGNNNLLCQKEFSKEDRSYRSVPVTSVESLFSSEAILRVASSETVLNTVTVRPVLETSEFQIHVSERPVSQLNKQIQLPKLSMPGSLLSNLELLSTLPQATKDLLQFPRNREQFQQTFAGRQSSKLSSILDSQSAMDQAQTTARIQEPSPEQSEQSSSFMSNEDDDDDDDDYDDYEDDEVIELSSVGESD